MNNETYYALDVDRNNATSFEIAGFSLAIPTANHSWSKVSTQ